jgi:hypothetical protein
MIAPDLGTVSELNARARADRVEAGEVAQDGLSVGDGGTAGVGDHVVTRQNERHLSTGRRWVRNGDRWRVSATHHDGSMTVERAGRGGGAVVLTADYVREHVELDYASTAHRAQGRTVDTAHAMVSPSTTLEVLYVSATRGRQANHLYVDTHYDPDPATGHDGAAEPVTATAVLAGVLAHSGADVAAHEVIRREQAEAEGMERLVAEYQTLATEAQAERWDALLARSGLSDAELEAVHNSPAYGPLIAALREAQARGLDVEATLPSLVERRSLAGVDDPAAVLHGRVDRANARVTNRRQSRHNLIAGLVPRAQGVADPDMARALDERDQAMQARARALAEEAVAARHEWLEHLGREPTDPIRRAQWMRAVTTVAAYRDLVQITSRRGVGAGAMGDDKQPKEYLQRVRGAIAAARALGQAETQQPTPDVDVPLEPLRGIDL